jgi:hypothetical protein
MTRERLLKLLSDAAWSVGVAILVFTGAALVGSVFAWTLLLVMEHYR